MVPSNKGSGRKDIPISDPSASLPAVPGWHLERVLGAGGQAWAYLASRPGDPKSKAVVKVLREWLPGGKQSSERAQRIRFDLEISTMRKVAAAGCPRIVPILAACDDVLTAPVVWYAMPYYASGSICRRDDAGHVLAWAEEYRGNVERVLEIAELLAETLASMHDIEVVHRDVHTSNVFFETPGGAPILGDFGLVHDRETSPPDLTGRREELGPWR